MILHGEMVIELTDENSGTVESNGIYKQLFGGLYKA